MYAIGTFELTIPNYLPDQYGIKTSLFTDFGTLGELDHTDRLTCTATTPPVCTINTNIARDSLRHRLRASGGSVGWRGNHPSAPSSLISAASSKKNYTIGLKPSASPHPRNSSRLHFHKVLTMTSKLFASAACATLTLWATCASAQQPAPARPPQPAASRRSRRGDHAHAVMAGICVFSQDQAIGGSIVGKAVNTRLEQLDQQSNAELNDLATKLQADEGLDGSAGDD